MKEKIHIIGSGWGCVGFIKHIDNNKYEVHVISKTDSFTYTPLLANNILNNYNLNTKLININNNIKIIQDEIIDLDNKNNELISKNNKYKYNNLILSHGASINTFNIKGVDEYCLFLKSSDDSEKLKNKLKKLNYNDKIVVIGTNLTGAEIVGNLIDHKKFNITAIDGLKYPLPSFDLKISNYVLDIWKNKGLNCINSNFVKNIDDKKIYYDNNKFINYNLAIWCGGFKSLPLTQNINKKLGFECKCGIPIDEYLNIQRYKNLFAIGDCSYSNNSPNAQLAYQQGKYLAHRFNNNFKIDNKFNYQNKGQICYIGDNKSVYQNKYFQTQGYLTYLFSKIVHVYNGVNIEQKINILFGKNNK